MGYFQVRYDSRVINYDRRGFIRLATEDFFGCIGSRSLDSQVNKIRLLIPHPTQPQL